MPPIAIPTKHALASAALLACCAPALANTQFSSGQLMDSALHASDLPVAQATTGNSLFGLKYVFRSGAFSGGLTLPLQGAQSGRYIKFRARVPRNVNLIVIPKNAGTTVATVTLDRRSEVRDELGWTTAVVDLGSVKQISEIDLAVDRTATNYPTVVHNYTGKLDETVSQEGIAYFREIELLTNPPGPVTAPVQAVAINTNAIGTYTIDNGRTLITPIRVSPANGDATQAIPYDFSGNLTWVGSQLGITKTDTQYIRMRVLALGSESLWLQANVGGQLSTYKLDLATAQADAAGWRTLLVDLKHPVTGRTPKAGDTLSGIQIQVNKSGTAPLQGTVYLREIDLLDQTPSPTTLYPDGDGNPGNVSIASATGYDTYGRFSSAPAQGPYVFDYDFTASGAPSSVGGKFALASDTPGSMLRLQLKAPKGLQIGLRFSDTNGSVHEYYQLYAVKPLAAAPDDGFVEYAAKLDKGSIMWTSRDVYVDTPTKGLIHTIEFTVERPYNRQVMESPNSPGKGQLVFRNLRITSENDGLDLTKGTTPIAAAGQVGQDLRKTVGVTINHPTAADIDIAADIGFGYARFGTEWQKVEDANGWHMLYEDALLRSLDRGLDTIFLLAYNNTLYAPITFQAVTTQTNADHFATYAAKVYNYHNQLTSNGVPLKGHVTYEVWNEENATGLSFWQGDGSEVATRAGHYALLLDTVATTSGIPADKLVSGGLTVTDELSYLDSLTAQSKQINTLAGIGYHPYQYASKDAQRIPEHQGSIKYALAEVASPHSTTPLWNTEVGASSQWWGAGDQDAPRAAQAVDVMREILTSWATGGPKHTVYQLRDLDAGTYSPNNDQHNFGLITQAGTDKPAKLAVKTLLSAAAGRQYRGIVTGSPSNLQALKFDGNGKETVFVAWNNTPALQGYVTTVSGTCDVNKNLDGTARSTPTQCITNYKGEELSCTRVQDSANLVACPVLTESGPIVIRMAP